MGATMADWAVRLRALAEPVVGDAPLPDPQTFRDELGHRRASDGAFLAWRRGEEWGAAQDAEVPDASLWAAVADSTIDASPLLDCLASQPRGNADSGSLLPQAGSPSIEVWTESELCALHALRWLAMRPPHAGLLDRAMSCAAWHLDNLQPDNATNRPWAVHVFIELAITGQRNDALLHAQTLIHNSQVALGRPDIMSAHILLDAADALGSGGEGQ
jgi:hypothetical protein